TRWAELAASGDGPDRYYSHLLETGRAHRVAGLLRKTPQTLPQLIRLLQAEDTPMAARIGVGVVLEELEGSDLLRQGMADLIALARSPRPDLRADAAHYLGLTRSPAAATMLQKLLQDAHPDVREIAADALQMLPPGADAG
ncbi:MAG: HEAT repeat domain-containing protein, partial [Candidatus Thiodiazotropha sp.]